MFWNWGAEQQQCDYLIERVSRLDRKLDRLQRGMDTLLADLKSQTVARNLTIRLGSVSEKPLTGDK